MIVTKTEIINKYGLHMRPAGEVADVASGFKSSIKIITKDREANAKSMMDLVMLGAKKGTKITIEADGEDADKAVIGIKELIEGGFKAE